MSLPTNPGCCAPKSEEVLRFLPDFIFRHLGRREMLASNDELTKRLDELERAYNEQFKIVFEAMRELMRRPRSKRKPVGFLADIPKKRSNHKRPPKTQR